MENNSLNHLIDKTQPNGQSTRLLSNIDVGTVLLTLFIDVAAAIALSVSADLLPKNMIGGLAVTMTPGFVLVKIGCMVSVPEDIGGSAILRLMTPSVLTHSGVSEAYMLDTVHLPMKETSLLYFATACLVVGSILGMNHTILIRGMVRISIPLVTGTGAIILASLSADSLFGHSIHHTFFFIIVPIIDGGIGERVPPLSLVYPAILGQTLGAYVAQLASVAVAGNTFAIICTGFLACMDARRSALSGNGMLTRSHNDNSVFAQHQGTQPTNFQPMGAGLLTTYAFLTVGGLLEKVAHIPGPVLMILATVFCKYTNVILTAMEPGTHSCHKFVSVALVWPLTVGLGMLYMPLESVVSASSVGYAVVCGSIVIVMALNGPFIAIRLNTYPVEVVIATSYHNGLEGTGDAATLSASNRMGPMPFVQIATWIGGVSMMVAAMLLLSWVV